MTSGTDAPIAVRFTPEFKRNLHALAKKYRHIRSDVQPVIDALQSGTLLGDQVPGVGARSSRCGFATVMPPRANVAVIACYTTSRRQRRSYW